jgi:hypothetical protein
LAVHTNNTREKSTGTSRKWSTNVPFCTVRLGGVPVRLGS